MELMIEVKSLEYIEQNTGIENLELYVKIYNKKQEQMLWDMYVHKNNEPITFDNFKEKLKKNNKFTKEEKTNIDNQVEAFRNRLKNREEDKNGII